jgi:hypothetical protein
MSDESEIENEKYKLENTSKLILFKYNFYVM